MFLNAAKKGAAKRAGPAGPSSEHPADCIPDKTGLSAFQFHKQLKGSALRVSEKTLRSEGICSAEKMDSVRREKIFSPQCLFRRSAVFFRRLLAR